MQSPNVIVVTMLATIAGLFILVPFLVWLQKRANVTTDGRSLAELNSQILAENLRTNEILKEAVARYDARLAAIESRLAQMEKGTPAAAEIAHEP